MKNNLSQVLTYFVRDLDIPVTGNSVDEELEKHPDYPSLLAASEVLNNWHVPNAAYPLAFKELLDARLEEPFIAHLVNKGGEFVLVSHLDEKHAIVSNERWRKHRLSAGEFEKMYNGTILVAEKEPESGEIDYNTKRRKELVDKARIPFVISGVVIILAAYLFFHSSFLTSLNWPIAFLTLFKTAGLFVTVMLLMQSIDANNPLIQRLCTGKNNDCNAILSSKAAKISEELSWSEAGFFYFAGTWLALLFNSGHPGIIAMLALLNLISLPYTFYSIYYQWRVAGQWCIFCCTVLALLWAEFFALLPSLVNGIQLPGLREWSALLMCLALPVLAWIFIKPWLLQAQKIQPLKQQLQTFKFNTELFNKMLAEEAKYALPEEGNSIIIGNREAEHIITMVSNPYCQPCSKAHKTLDEWLANRADIKLQLVFSTGSDERDPKARVAHHLMALQSNQNDSSLKKALNDWYEHKHKDYESWAKSYPVIKEHTSHSALEKQKEWCTLVEIKSTPTIFINGRRLPQNYQPEDIKYFI